MSFGGDAAAAARTTHVSRRVCPLDDVTGAAFVDNTITNSRYTPMNFLPKNLFEQFRRPLNAYFLLVALLQFNSAIAPVNPLSTLLPLLFAFTLTAVKEGYDDVKRHRQDHQANSRLVDVLVEGQGWVKVRSADVRVGNVILLHVDDEIPVDCVAIAAAGMGGQKAASAAGCFMRTDNMDGETDLKPRDVLRLHDPSDTDPLAASGKAPFAPHSAPEDIAAFARRLTIVCPPPHAVVDSFEARAEVAAPVGGLGYAIALSHTHLLLQSCYLKKTASAVAIVCYTGSDTKCGLNKRPAPQKWAAVDQTVSSYSKVIFVFQMAVALVLGIAGYRTNRTIQDQHWYLQPSDAERSAASAALIYPLRFFLLTTVMIPISFKFVVDSCKYYMSLVLEADLAMYDDARGEAMRVRNSSIVEDLGQIQFVLSDKTGTMTENAMVLRYCSVAGHKLACDAATLLPAAAIEEFFVALALCNSVETQTEPSGAVTYSAVSPDDEALCHGAAAFGVRLLSRCRDAVVVDVLSQPRTWHLLHVFPFSSEHKAMGVVVQEHDSTDGRSPKPIQLIVKGADDKIFSMVAPDQPPAGRPAADVAAAGDTPPLTPAQVLSQHLTDFAATGLRTLAVATRTIPAADWASFERAHAAAMLETADRERHVTALRDGLSQGLTLLGATAIEDRLQAGVAQTMTELAEANVKVWMLTGDKVETAQQIAVASGLFRFDDDVVQLTAGTAWEAALLSVDERQVKVATGRPQGPYAPRAFAALDNDTDSDISQDALLPAARSNKPPQSLVTYDSSHRSKAAGGSDRDAVSTVLLVQGGAVLDKILHTPDLLAKFTAVAMRCKSAVCARVTPAQKAQIAELVRRQGFMTLAVGDGGNDVAMIQEAHVGVGILGKEGQQAARAADFTVTRFRHLSPLMLVHGHLSYSRTCFIVKYSFYKSMLISFVQLVFNLQCTLLSGVSFWNSLSLTMWNGCYTLPQTMLFALDRSAPRVLLESNPVLYRATQRGLDMTPAMFAECIARGVLQSVGGFWLTMYGAEAPGADGQTSSRDTSFATAYTGLMLLQMLTVVCESSSLTWLNLASIAGMPALYLGVTWVYATVPRLQFFGVFQRTMSSQLVLVAMAIAVGLFLPRLVLCVHLHIHRPTAKQVLRQGEVQRQMRLAAHRAAPCGGSGGPAGAWRSLWRFLPIFTAEDPSLELPHAPLGSL